jgi:hypothetical protein
MREAIGTRFSFPIRLLCVCGGASPVAFAGLVFGRVDFQDHVTLILVSLLLIWGVGTAWVLAARATELRGWGELQIGELVLLPLVTLFCVFGLFFMLFLWALGHMH